MSTEEWPRGTRVRKPGFGYTGEVYKYETKFRTRFCVVHWDGRPFTAREQQHCLERIEDES